MDTSQSEAWRETIAKEQRVCEVWKAQYAPDLLKKEKKKLHQAKKAEKQTLKRTPSMERLLLDGISHEGKGRAAYLKHQRSKSPQRKYRHPQTSSQEVGWECEGKRLERPDYGRKNIIKTTFYRPTGFH